MWFVYKYTHKDNNKSYIGYTKNLRRRNNDHFNSKRVTKFHCACRKYGKDAFEQSILAETQILLEAKELEKKFIKQYDTFNTGYNGTLGGDGVCPEAIMGEKNPNYRCKSWTDESRKKNKENRPSFIGEKNPFYGKNHTNESKKMVSQANTGKKRSSDFISKCKERNSMGKNPKAKRIIINNIEYQCIKDAITKLNFKSQYQLLKANPSAQIVRKLEK